MTYAFVSKKNPKAIQVSEFRSYWSKAKQTMGTAVLTIQGSTKGFMMICVLQEVLLKGQYGDAIMQYERIISGGKSNGLDYNEIGLNYLN
jgi:ribosomal protein RSM22 (predicted rRNA methylase)